ncbi:MAG TPA: tRNA preQ1(34) S-adenosylmethionine ribosyltransferase-isomerase QueA [Candidatus Nanoarchaeia archaeon]|nr:tRNA preQ1(34) S-adenosylmethionine ribosyltransferase-isomerase QueA [Candidatus Nanoarchaeia archaeon]
MDQKTNLDHYHYNLFPELIAQTAFRPRDHCKLMVLQRKQIEHKKFYEIIDYLNPGDVLILNETKVRKCRLMGKKKTGGKIEVTLVKEVKSSTQPVYQCRIKGRNLRVSTKLLFSKNKGEIILQEEGIFYVKFEHRVNEEECALLTPPYIKTTVPEKDYQTIFAKVPGSLAAPTAGLHFTPELLKKIGQKGIKIAKIQLDISFATFLPVRNFNNHKTGEEYFVVDKKNAAIINSALNAGGKMIAVGTTVVKCLESCDWVSGKIKPRAGLSKLFIKPGYKFKAPLAAMITNFHLPKSSLLLLTCAYAGRERILRAYAEAIRKKYRFYSLGDGMMIWKR